MSARSNSQAEPQPPVWIDYDYAVVRVVPSVARGAFVNVGVVLHARRARFLEARLHPDVATWPDLATLPDVLLQGALDAYTAVCAGHGVIGCYPPSERFHWLTAPRSAALRTSPVHSGRTTDPATTLAALYKAVVLGGIEQTSTARSAGSTLGAGLKTAARSRA